MPDQTSSDELRKEILTEFKQVLKLAPADYTENCTNVVMSLFDQNRQSIIDQIKSELGEKKDLPEPPREGDDFDIGKMKHAYYNEVLGENQMHDKVTKILEVLK